MSTVRTPTVAGLFYPNDPEQLRQEINSFLLNANPSIQTNNIFGIVSPHAGYTYSGKTAAHVYKLLDGRHFRRVIIISPSHNEYFPGISIYEGEAYETPLGLLEVDKEFSKKLVDNSKMIFEGIEGHRKEHALEVQLPFLQVTINNFKIVPIVMGDQSKIFVEELASKLAEHSDNETLIVASSDMSHFYSKSRANKLDSIVEKRISNFDFEKLLDDLDSGKAEACGGGPIAALMKAASIKNIKRAQVIHRSDSGDVSGDNREVVGYLSAVIYS